MSNDKAILVQIESGKLRGYIQRSCLGDDYYTFKGIPYAKPPVGPLRFQDPEPPEPWSGVRDALEHGPMSLQYLFEKPDQMSGSEDCLYLNVYARKIDSHLRQPVMVWIHGGGFVKHSGHQEHYGPDYFMSKEIVLVTINYRLGVFGFLNLEDEIATGNQGLKDQVLALQWVKNNISALGGDPENVTIFGESAGSASVHYLTLSPLAEGLFHKAICQSGTVLNPWAVKRETQKSLSDFLTLLGYDKKREPKAILAFLKSLDSHKLIEAQEKLTSAKAWLQLNFPFGPCIDDKSLKPFMPVHPRTVAEKKGTQVPLMVGHTSFEGLFMLYFLDAVEIKEFDRNFENHVSGWLSDILRKYNLTLEDFKKMYFESEKISEKTLERLLKVYNDGIFIEGIHNLLSIQVKNSGAPTYFYKFSYDKNKSFFQLNRDIPFKGANHGDELNYQFTTKEFGKGGILKVQEVTDSDRIMKQMIELWTNFAKTGRPTPKTSKLIPCYWQPVTNEVVLRYLNIDEDIRMEKDLNIDQHYSCKKNIFQ